MRGIQSKIKTVDLLFIMLVLLCACLILSSFRYLVFFEGADEGYYLKYAALASEYGPKVFPAFFKAYVADPKNWVFPNPFRIGYILLSALWVNMFGVTYFALSGLSLLCYLLMLGVSYYFSGKYFGKKFALLFSALIGFSPLNMAMARRPLVDSASNCFLVMSLWLFFDMLQDRKRNKYAVFVVVYTAAILMKESAVLFMPVFILYLIVRKYALKKPACRADFFCSCVCPMVITLAIYAVAAGSLSNVWETIKIIIKSPSMNPYAILHCSGSWTRYIFDFFLISPLVLLLALAFIFSYFFLEKLNTKTAYSVTAQPPQPSRRYRSRGLNLCYDKSSSGVELLRYFLIVALGYYFLLNFFAKNIRYAMLLDTPLRLFALGMILRFTREDGISLNMSKNIGLNRLYAPLIVFGLVLFDYFSFYQLFVSGGIYDPVSVFLLSARGLTP